MQTGTELTIKSKLNFIDDKFKMGLLKMAKASWFDDLQML